MRARRSRRFLEGLALTVLLGLTSCEDETVDPAGWVNLTLEPAGSVAIDLTVGAILLSWPADVDVSETTGSRNNGLNHASVAVTRIDSALERTHRILVVNDPTQVDSNVVLRVRVLDLARDRTVPVTIEQLCDDANQLLTPADYRVAVSPVGG